MPSKRNAFAVIPLLAGIITVGNNRFLSEAIVRSLLSLTSQVGRHSVTYIIKAVSKADRASLSPRGMWHSVGLEHQHRQDFAIRRETRDYESVSGVDHDPSDAFQSASARSPILRYAVEAIPNAR